MAGLRLPFTGLVFAATLCSGSGGQSVPRGMAAAIVERTSCLGSCPSYEAEIHADGRVVWNGRVGMAEHAVAVKGRTEARVDAAAVAAVFKKYFPQAEREVCVEERGIDSPVYYILFSRKGNLAQVRAERDEYHKRRNVDPTVTDPCSLNENFDAAIAELERVANTHRWLHGNESLQDTDKVSADVFYGTKPGFTPLMQAAGRDNLEDVIAKAGADPVDSADETGWTALMVASSRCRSEAVSFLLSKGANSNAHDRNGDSPLIAAATAYCSRFDTDEQPKARYALIKQFAAAGARVNATNTAGQTPLMVAARFGNDDAIRALLDLGASVQVKDKAGLDAKAYATKYQREIHKYNSDYQREYKERFRHCLQLLANAQRKGGVQ